MVSLEQVKLLEARVSRTIEYVKKVTDDNIQLKEKLSSYQKRIDELEVLVTRFKQDQNRIEDGILSALDRLSQFEGALENALSREKEVSKEDIPKNEISLPSETVATREAINIPVLDDDSVSGDDQKTESGELDIF